MPTTRAVYTAGAYRKVFEVDISASNDSGSYNIAPGIDFSDIASSLIPNFLRVIIEPISVAGATALAARTATSAFSASNNSVSITMSNAVSGAAASGSSAIRLHVERVHSITD